MNDPQPPSSGGPMQDELARLRERLDRAGEDDQVDCEMEAAQLAQDCGDAARVASFVCDVGDESQVEQSFATSVDALVVIGTQGGVVPIAGMVRDFPGRVLAVYIRNVHAQPQRSARVAEPAPHADRLTRLVGGQRGRVRPPGHPRRPHG